MAFPSSASNGTQSATTTTVNTLYTTVGAGTFQLDVDANAMANGDLLTLDILVPALSGGTARSEKSAAYKHAQGEPILKSLPVVCPHAGVVFKLTWTGSGGPKSFPWNVVQLA